MPSWLVVAALCTPVAVLVAITAAPGMAALLTSTTEPRRLAVAWPYSETCAIRANQIKIAIVENEEPWLLRLACNINSFRTCRLEFRVSETRLYRLIYGGISSARSFHGADVAGRRCSQYVDSDSRGGAPAE